MTHIESELVIFSGPFLANFIERENSHLGQKLNTNTLLQRINHLSLMQLPLIRLSLLGKGSTSEKCVF